MFDIGWTEMAIIAFVALIVIGPKDLPRVMRMVGQWVRKARSLSRDFQSGLDEMMRETELDEARKTIESTRRMNIDKIVDETVDPTGEVGKEMRALDDDAKRAARGEDAPAAGGAAEAGEDDGEARRQEASAGEGTGRAQVIKHPLQVAPAHSVTPPREESAPNDGVADDGVAEDVADEAPKGRKSGG